MVVFKFTVIVITYACSALHFQGTQLKTPRLNLIFLKLHVYLWQNLNGLFIAGLSAGVKNTDFPRYPAAETVNERPLKGPGVPWQHFGGSCF